MIRIGIAGGGAWGQLHLANFLKHPQAKVVAVATRSGQLRDAHPNREQVRSVRDLTDLRRHTDFRELCTATDIDAVCVALPTHLHAEATILALKSGKHVLCEKPMALTTEEARQMLDTAKTSGKTLMIAHCLRFWPEYVAAERIVRSDRYGRAVAASFSRCGGLPPWGSDNWFNDPRRSGGAVIDLHIHDADICVWLWGKPEQISASGVHPNHVHSHWRYKDGPAVQLEAAWDSVAHKDFYFNFRIALERATLFFDTRLSPTLRLATAQSVEAVPTDSTSGYEAEAHYFLNSLLGGKPVDRCPPTESLLSLECCVDTARQLATRLRKTAVIDRRYSPVA